MDKNPEFYQHKYLKFIDKKINTYKLKVFDIDYLQLTDFGSFSGVFNSPSEILNSIKMICFYELIVNKKPSEIYLIGTVEKSIFKVLETFSNSKGIKLNYKNSIIIKKYDFTFLSTIRYIFKIFLASFRIKKLSNLKSKIVFLNYTDKNNKINYWGNLIKIFNEKITNLNIDINESLKGYYDKNSLYVFSNFNFKRFLLFYIAILNIKFKNSKGLYAYNKDLDFSPFFKVLHKRSFFGTTALKNSIFYSFFFSFFNRNRDVKFIFYPRENQPWEKIMLSLANKKVISIGNLHSAHKFWDLRILYSNSLLPNYFTLHSSSLIDILKSKPFLENENFIKVESLRLNNYDKSNNSNKGMLVILDYDFDKSKEMIDLVKKLTVDLDNYKIKFRTHISSEKKIKKHYSNLNFDNTDLFKAIDNYTHFFCSNNTSLGLEFYISGLNVAIMDSKELLDMNPIKVYNHEINIIKEVNDLNQFINSENKNKKNRDLIHLDKNLRYWSSFINKTIK